MNQPLLSILIPTVVGREENVNGLLSLIEKRVYYDNEDFSTSGGGSIILQRRTSLLSIIEILICKDRKEMTIGEKREFMYLQSNGVYSWSIDDDDLFSEDAITLITEAIIRNPEVPCVTFRESCTMNGVYKSSNHSIKYEKWQDNFDGYDYVRCPFYKDVIRTDIARSVPFPYIRYNEDEQWSMAIKPFLTDEIHIDEELYLYQYNPKPEETHEQRYGINR